MKLKDCVYLTIIGSLTAILIVVSIKNADLRSENHHYASFKKDQFAGQDYGQLFQVVVKVVPQKNQKIRGNFVVIESINGKKWESMPEWIRYKSHSEDDLEVGSQYACTAFFAGAYVGLPDSPELKDVASCLFHFENQIYLIHPVKIP